MAFHTTLMLSVKVHYWDYRVRDYFSLPPSMPYDPFFQLREGGNQIEKGLRKDFVFWLVFSLSFCHVVEKALLEKKKGVVVVVRARACVLI
jgi:hypothetical protein